MASSNGSYGATGNEKIAVLGAGSFGCTLAYVFAGAGKKLKMWHVIAEEAEFLNKNRRLEKPITVDIVDGVEVSSDLKAVVADADILLFTCTSQSMQEVAARVYQVVKDKPKKPILLSAVKGIETQTFKRMSEILKDALPGFPLACLSGPNLAVEISRGLPTAAVIAADDHDIAKYLQSQLNAPSFRLYTNDDVIGVELGGALKNIYAIAAGCMDGLNLGTNAKSTFLTRSLVEMNRFNSACGGKAATMAGLAGIGDLIATCTSPLSRNYRLGYELSCGIGIDEAIAKLGAVAEGVPTCHAVNKLAKSLPLICQLWKRWRPLFAARQRLRKQLKIFWKLWPKSELNSKRR